MPKFEMKVIEPAQVLADGTRKDARVALIPVDDAAKIMPRSKDALAIGAWVPTEKDAIKKAAERLAETQTVADQKKGRCNADTRDAYKAQLLKKVYKA